MEIYLDNSATTKPSEAVIAAMNLALTGVFGNPSSLHRHGLEAEKKLKAARRQISSILKIKDEEFVFTSGGTESNNLAILGSLSGQKKDSHYLVTTEIEHPSVLNVFKHLETQGYQVTYLKVNQAGIIDLNEFKTCLDKKPALVSIMMVNNEIGAIQPINEIGRLISQASPKPLFHVDAVQAFGKIEFSINKPGVDMLSISAHKFHGPKGIGGLYLRKGIKIQPLFFGGNQENSLRPGTENLPAITGMAVAATEALSEVGNKQIYLESLTHRLLSGIIAEIEGVKINTPDGPLAAPHILNVSFLGIGAEILLHALEGDGIYVSTRSACTSRKKSFSHVLTALKLNPEVMESAVRFSVCVQNTEAEIDYVIERLRYHVTSLRRIISGVKNYNS